MMLVFYIILFCSLFFGLSVKRSGFYDDFLGRKQTDAVKGLFIGMVFLSHALLDVASSGFTTSGVLDMAGYRLRADLGQLIIVPFLFYSGYGVMEAIREKGRAYLNSFPRRRLLNTLLNFDVAVLVFICLNLLMGISMELKQVAWSLIGWKSVGNSNWYIFVILLCYLASWISGMVFREGGWKVLALTTMLVLAAEAGLSFLKHGQPWWYNTMLCYPAGMCISLVKDKFTSFVQHYYGLVLGLLAAVFLFLHFQKWIPALRGLTFNAKSIVFMLFIVLVTMKVKTGNRFLFWAGACVFPIYIYQRLPMRAFRHWAGDAWVSANPYLFMLACMVVTGIIACLYRHWQVKLT